MEQKGKKAKLGLDFEFGIRLEFGYFFIPSKFLPMPKEV
jgi:hypothetical protein